jgi:hypothetical protein
MFQAYSQNRKKRLIASSCLSNHQYAWKNLVPTEQIFMEFDISGFYKNLLQIFKFQQNLTGTMGTLHEDLRTFKALSPEFF